MSPERRPVLPRNTFRLFSRNDATLTIKKGVMLRNCMKSGQSALLSVFILSSLVCFVSISCTPPAPVISKCPEPVWKSYTHLSPQEVARQISLLEKMLDSATAENSLMEQQNDSTTSEKFSLLEIYQRLFELSIHHANPGYDYEKTYRYLTHLYQHGGKDSLRYLNWGRVVRDRESLLKERDSLSNIVNDASHDEKKSSRMINRLNRDVTSCRQQLDSLTTEITTQRKTIQKLQKLDVLMEQRRNTIE
jgi:hypothetical protein